MPAPRLHVGYMGKTDLADELARVGHRTTPITGGESLEPFDLIVIEQVWWAIPVLAEGMSQRIRKGQMVLHTAVEVGVQALDPFEVNGAIVMAAHRVWKNYWVTSAADDVGESVVNLLISEIGGNVTLIEDRQRPAIKAAERMRALSYEVSMDAYNILRRNIRAIEPDAVEFWGPEDEPMADTIDVDELESIYGAIESTDIATLYAALERRYASRNKLADQELWALGKRPM